MKDDKKFDLNTSLTAINPMLAVDFKKLSKKELIHMAETFMMPFAQPDKYKELVRASNPKWVAGWEKIEDTSKSVYESTQEFQLILADCLRRYHGWNEAQILQLHRELTDVLTGAKEFEDQGLTFLSVHDSQMLGEKVEELGIAGLMKQIYEIKHKKNSMSKMGMEPPVQVGASKMAKEMSKLKK